MGLVTINWSSVGENIQMMDAITEAMRANRVNPGGRPRRHYASLSRPRVSRSKVTLREGM